MAAPARTMNASQPTSGQLPRRVTTQTRSILARHLGERELSPIDKEKSLSVTGRQLIEESLTCEGHVDTALPLDSRLFLSHGGQRRLLRESSLLTDQ